MATQEEKRRPKLGQPSTSTRLFPRSLLKLRKNTGQVCILSRHNCGITVDIADGHIENIPADETSPLSHSYICDKRFGVNRGHHLSLPPKRKPDGEFERISWDQAISVIAFQLKAITAEHFLVAFGLVGIGGQANHLYAPSGVIFLWLMKSRRLFNTLAQEKTQHRLVGKWMLDNSSGARLRLRKP